MVAYPRRKRNMWNFRRFSEHIFDTVSAKAELTYRLSLLAANRSAAPFVRFLRMTMRNRHIYGVSRASLRFEL